MKKLEALRPDQAGFVYFFFFTFFLKNQNIGVGWGRRVGGRFKRGGMHVYLWLIHVEVCRKQNSVKQ